MADVPCQTLDVANSPVRGGLVPAGFRAERDSHAVPGVDAGDGPGEVGQFLVGEMAAGGVVGGVGDVAVGDVGQGLGPLEGGAFAVGVVRGFAPGVQAVEALLAFAGGAGVLPVHVDAIGAAVDLGGAQLDHVQQGLVEAA